MSTYVNDLRLEEIGTGERSGTWGTATNTNLELIGEALGFGTEAITTNADTHATTVADGSSDPGRAMFIKYTGTLDSTCTITIGPNTMSRVHIIENATSGSQSIIIKQGSGATITIPSGATKIVYLDGAGSGAAVVDALVDLSLAGNTTITTTDNSTNLSLISTDTDANVGPVLNLNRNVTGASSDVLGRITFDGKDDAGNATTYARIDTQIVDASNGSEDSALLIHSLTGGSERERVRFTQTETVFNEGSTDLDFRVESDGNANMINVDAGDNRVGIGMIPDTTVLTVSGQVGTTNGTASAPTHTFYSDADTGMFRSGANALAFSTGGSQAMNIDSSQRVTISHVGTDTTLSGGQPGLQVTGSGFDGYMAAVRRDSTSFASGIILAKSRNTTADNFTIVQDNDQLGSILFIGDDGTDLDTYGATIAAKVNGTPAANDMPTDLIFSTNGGSASPTERMRVLSGGGLTFNGDTATANALDDYEEGTWTPSVSGSGSLSGTSPSLSGRYIKIGDFVSVKLTITNSAGDLQVSSFVGISGVPFSFSESAQGVVLTEDIDVFARQGFASCSGTNFFLSACGSSSGTVALVATVSGRI